MNLLEIKTKYSDERRSNIEKILNEIDIEDLIQEEDVVITLTNSGYIKRISADTYSVTKKRWKGYSSYDNKGR